MAERPRYTARLADITPEDMRRTTKAMEAMALENRIENPINLIEPFRCSECGRISTSVATAIGHTEWRIPCDPFTSRTNDPASRCRGIAVSEGYKPGCHLDDYEGPIAYKWARPTTAEECEKVREDLRQSATFALDHDEQKAGMSGTERELYLRRIHAQLASNLLRGKIILRPYNPS